MSRIKELILPGLIDPHTHLREPGGEHKEDFFSGTRAALKGGFTTVGVMPNTSPAITTLTRLEQWKQLARKAVCDTMLYFGTNGRNFSELVKAKDDPAVFGLKVYCNQTTGDLLVEDRMAIREIFSLWESTKPILVHAEGAELLGFLVELAAQTGRHLHICHVSTKDDLEVIRLAKQDGMQLSCEVCPHHLFLTEADEGELGSLALMKPRLGTQVDQDALWQGLNGTIDCIATDHAPHTLTEKQSNLPPFGVPGLETALGLMLTAASVGKLPYERLSTLMHDNAQRIFQIPPSPDSFVVVDPGKLWVVGEDGYQTRCGWSPFDGWALLGLVETVVFKGRTVVSGGKWRKR